jgi:glycosyltransferase involved in cell wall biosynthesis
LAELQVKAKLSVIIASYNHQDYIAQTLESLEKQTFTDFEIILIDDGSTDRTVEVARSCPSRAQIFRQENLGVVAARNRGISMAQGKYLCFVDSDDLVLPERFARQVAALDADAELGLVFADAVIIDSTGRQLGKFSDIYPVVPGNVAEMLVLHYCFIPMITVMVRADVLSKTGPFEAPGPISDYIKWIEIADISKVHYFPDLLGCWRRHPTSTSKGLDAEKKYALTRVWLKKTLRKYPELQAAVGKNIAKRFSRSYFLTAFSLAADGNIERARKYYRKAVKVYPWTFANWIGLVVTVIVPRSLAAKLHRHIRSKRLPW